MDFDNLKNLSQMRGMINVNEMTGIDMGKFPNMFGGEMYMNTTDVFCKIQV